MTDRPSHPKAEAFGLALMTKAPPASTLRGAAAAAALLLLPALSMCGGPPAALEPAPQPVESAVSDVPAVVEPDTTFAGELRKADSILAQADELLRQGDYEPAIAAYLQVLELKRADDPAFRELRARALWGAALTHLVSLTPNGDTSASMTLLETLVTSYDGTVEAAQARWAVALLDQMRRLRAQSADKDEDIRRLNETIEQLKRIDLSRRPSGIEPL
jgi:tetratricopeptide (TPR) repeat protein